jgi:alkanesulfonate monooxygenase SsuD/methylene tetrahydromethanopterin reductase-like flavin-dependent oxidoreductase (luciferase family)
MTTERRDHDGGQRRTWDEHPWVAEGRGRVRLGIGVTTRAPEVDGTTRLAFARAVDELGVDSLWAPDHPMFITDCWVALAAYAAVTTRVRLGPLVSCSLYRTPLMTARLAADIDRLSGGRAVLGIGAGWLTPEFQLMRMPLPPPRECVGVLTQTLAYVSDIWNRPRADIDLAAMQGTGEAPWWPPVQHPRIPILVGGTGERTTLRRVAEYADMCNFEDTHVPTAEDVHRKLSVLRAHCAAVGRPYGSIIKSYFANAVVLAPTPARVQVKVAALPPIFAATAGPNMGTPEEFIARLRPLVAEGIDYLIVNLTGFEDAETLELLATEVGPALQSIREREATETMSSTGAA